MSKERKDDKGTGQNRDNLSLSGTVPEAVRATKDTPQASQTVPTFGDFFIDFIKKISTNPLRSIGIGAAILFISAASPPVGIAIAVAAIGRVAAQAYQDVNTSPIYKATNLDYNPKDSIRVSQENQAEQNVSTAPPSRPVPEIPKAGVPTPNVTQNSVGAPPSRPIPEIPKAGVPTPNVTQNSVGAPPSRPIPEIPKAGVPTPNVTQNKTIDQASLIPPAPPMPSDAKIVLGKTPPPPPLRDPVSKPSTINQGTKNTSLAKPDFAQEIKKRATLRIVDINSLGIDLNNAGFKYKNIDLLLKDDKTIPELFNAFTKIDTNGLNKDINPKLRQILDSSNKSQQLDLLYSAVLLSKDDVVSQIKKHKTNEVQPMNDDDWETGVDEATQETKNQVVRNTFSEEEIKSVEDAAAKTKSKIEEYIKSQQVRDNIGGQIDAGKNQRIVPEKDALGDASLKKQMVAVNADIDQAKRPSTPPPPPILHSAIHKTNKHSKEEKPLKAQSSLKQLITTEKAKNTNDKYSTEEFTYIRSNQGDMDNMLMSRRHAIAEPEMQVQEAFDRDIPDEAKLNILYTAIIDGKKEFAQNAAEKNYFTSTQLEKVCRAALEIASDKVLINEDQRKAIASSVSRIATSVNLSDLKSLAKDVKLGKSNAQGPTRH